MRSFSYVSHLHKVIQINVTVICSSGQFVWGVLFCLYLLEDLAGREQKVQSHGQQHKSSNAASGDGLERYLTDTCPNGFCGAG